MIQSILPCFTEPLLCELFFRNYIKYKKKVDRLVIVTNYSPGYEFIYNSLLEELKTLLETLNVENYQIININYAAGHHACTFKSVLKEIKDEKYHSFFDEQDAYVIDESFIEDKKKLLNENIDLIGCKKCCFLKNDRIDKFNETYNVKHNEGLYTLHLPQFLSNRIIKKIDDLSFDQRSMDSDEIFAKNDFLDTFQYINLQVYKKTDKIKLYDYEDWCVTSNFYNKNEINFYNNFLYHAQASRMLTYTQMFKRKTHEELDFYFKNMSLVSGYELNLNFYYQCLKYLPNFKYKDIYIDNFNKIKDKFDFNRFDCSKLIERII